MSSKTARPRARARTTTPGARPRRWSAPDGYLMAARHGGRWRPPPRGRGQVHGIGVVSRRHEGCGARRTQSQEEAMLESRPEMSEPASVRTYKLRNDEAAEAIVRGAIRRRIGMLAALVPVVAIGVPLLQRDPEADATSLLVPIVGTMALAAVIFIVQ